MWVVIADVETELVKKFDERYDADSRLVQLIEVWFKTGEHPLRYHVFFVPQYVVVQQGVKFKVRHGMVDRFFELAHKQFFLWWVFQHRLNYHVNEFLESDFVPEYLVGRQWESCDVFTLQMLLFNQHCLCQSQSYVDSLDAIFYKLIVILLFLFRLRHGDKSLEKLSV